MADPTFDPDSSFANVTGLPGVAFVQDDAYFDSAQTYVATPTADVEFVELTNSRTNASRFVSLATLKGLLA